MAPEPAALTWTQRPLPSGPAIGDVTLSAVGGSNASVGVADDPAVRCRQPVYRNQAVPSPVMTALLRDFRAFAAVVGVSLELPAAPQLAAVWMGWAEMELRHKHYELARAALKEATKSYPVEKIRAKAGGQVTVIRNPDLP